MTYRGELVYTFLFDLGGEVRMGDAARLLAEVPAAGKVEPSKSAPPYLALVEPLVVAYPDAALATDRGDLAFRVSARVYAIGAVGVSLRLPYEVADLRALHDLALLKGAKESLEESARRYADAIERRIHSALVETYAADVEPEGYLVVVMTETTAGALELLQKESQMVAGLVAGEKRPDRLSEEEVRDNLRTWFRYYEDDLVVVDWDRALVVEPSGKYDDVLTVIEAANLELLELRVYDRYLDAVLEDAYEDISRFYGRGGLFRSARVVQEELSDARIDLVRVTDAINNIGKIFGDYYLAKLHLGLTERFHLGEWEAIVREKMATLNELYQLASHEVEHRRGMALELGVIALFVLDIAIILIALARA